MARSHLDISLDMTAQELLAPLGGLIEIDDVGVEDLQLEATASLTQPQIQAVTLDDAFANTDDSIEIELTADQMDAMLKEIEKK